MKLGLLSCTKSKQNYTCSAAKMYEPSTLFSKAYRYARKNYDIIGILSAKYGILLPDEIIEPYELSLKTMRKKHKQAWAVQVNSELSSKFNFESISRIYIHAGKDYREHLLPLIEKRKIAVEIPLEGLSFGQQLKWYKDRL
jgi:hypothetical protein